MTGTTNICYICTLYIPVCISINIMFLSILDNLSRASDSPSRVLVLSLQAAFKNEGDQKPALLFLKQNN